MEYKEFQKKFTAETKANGGKVTMKALNKAWKILKKQEKQNAKNTKISKPSVEQPKDSTAPKENSEAGKEKIEIQKQAAEIIQSQPRSNEPAATTEPAKPAEPVKEISAPLPAPTAPISQPAEDLKKEEMYTAIADSVHTALSGIVALMTEKKVQIERDKIERLNKCGVLLLKKYDTSGQILEYSPEIAYVLTLADIGSQVYIEMKKRTPKQAPQPTLPAPATNTSKEIGDFNTLIKQAGGK